MSLLDCGNDPDEPACPGCWCDRADGPDAELALMPTNSSLADILDRGDAALADTSIPLEDAVLAATFVIRHATSVADAEFLHEALGLSGDREEYVFSSAARRTVPVSSLRRTA